MADPKGLKVDTMRTFLGRARGLGSAKSGFDHWWIQRLTSIALVPLTLWFIWSLAHLTGQPYAEVRAWAGNIINATLLLTLIVLTFEHLHLGVQVVCEDYIHTDVIRTPVILAVKAASLLLGLAATIAVLKLAITG
ncbi:Succinate dehydrogenase hydrophobic membrane anchor protein [Rhodovastum atsumiense]|uniref:Succinate dehydrogenase hydrophobic membrane anchor subunit n=1 Tax=Rhodovastum atsumiense TaxID=504468 RepID=A0A5M6IY47_9PROT|nr:succinate dehydrogenase, hydrophobic membrane anchor protein [Rhodovastum atsumiense]KAA5612298.1 succinate dehydrogenase, hydrophobic membrane anchor protein [Rhodovastum atsumiense]CAH2601628.1 Succinate dehydrogenase hydrophobic membrane anchor protein [Rhodovastum atsumiense]